MCSLHTAHALCVQHTYTRARAHSRTHTHTHTQTHTHTHTQEQRPRSKGTWEEREGAEAGDKDRQPAVVFPEVREIQNQVW